MRWSSPSGCCELSSWSCSDSSGRRCSPVWREISDLTRWRSESSFLPLTDPPLAYASPPPASVRIGSLQTQNLIQHARKSRLFYCSLMSVSLTVMGHPEHQALLETTELTFIPTFLLYLTAALAFLIFQLHANGPPEKSLGEIEKIYSHALKILQ